MICYFELLRLLAWPVLHQLRTSLPQGLDFFHAAEL